MFKFLSNLFSKKPALIQVIVKRGTSSQIIFGKQGDNLMDATNKIINNDANIYGLCNKQLACTTCSVHVKTHFNKLPPPTQEQVDVLYGLPDYREGETRMACQITLKKELDGMVVEIRK